MIAKEDIKEFLSYYNIDYLPQAENLVLESQSLGKAVSGASSGASSKASILDKLSLECSNCKNCSLHTQRTKTVFGAGSLDADIFFVGEAPGEEEDRQGEPFVGEAGQLLTKAITNGLKLKREDVYIANILKCLPPEKKNALEDEVKSCFHFIEKQIKTVSPKVIVTLGSSAQKALAGPNRGGPSEGITKVRGTWLDFEGIPLMPTFHPAYLLRNQAAKKPFWEDLKEVIRFIAE